MNRSEGAAGPPLVVLAAGMSRRYGQLKQLEGLGPCGSAIMDYNVFDAMRAGFSRVVFVIRDEIEDRIREHVESVVGTALPVEFVRQSLGDLPDGFRPPPERANPWGTGQAVLRASQEISGPFAVCNADDLYGAEAFRKLYTRAVADPAPTEAALMGYTLSDTLSGSGGVARGICVMGRDHTLERVTEVHDIRSVDGWISGTDTEGETVELRGGEVVSMNLWVFTDPVVDLLGRQFARFLDRWGADTEAEFLLSTAINGQIQIGAARVAVLHSGDEWFGVTHPSDRDEAEASLAERVARGDYPADLPAAFREFAP